MNTYNLTEPKAGDAWRNHIKQFEALDSWFNSLSEVTQLWLSQQIDIFAGKYPISGAKKEDIPEADQRDGIYGVREKERLYAFAKFMNQWQSENEQWNERELRNIINDFVAQNTTKEPVIDLEGLEDAKASFITRDV